MDVTACIFLLGMMNIVMHIALQGSIAARRVGVEPTARLHSEVRRLLDRLHGEIPAPLHDDRLFPTGPGADGRTVFVVVPPPGLTFLAAPTRAAAQMLCSALFRLALLASGVIEVIRFHGALQLPL